MMYLLRFESITIEKQVFGSGYFLMVLSGSGFFLLRGRILFNSNRTRHHALIYPDNISSIGTDINIERKHFGDRIRFILVGQIRIPVENLYDPFLLYLAATGFGFSGSEFFFSSKLLTLLFFSLFKFCLSSALT